MNGYVCFYKGNRYEVHADTLFEARAKLAKKLKVKKEYEITVMLAEKNGEQVTHIPTM